MSRWWLLLLPFLVGWTPIQQCYIYDGGDRPQRVRLTDYPESVWTPVDLSSSGVPKYAVAATLSGVIVITHGTTPGTCWLEAYARPTGREWNIYAKAVETSVGGGVRHPWTFTVKLTEASFDLWWAAHNTDSNPWPAGCSYDIALIVGEWCK